MRACELGAIGHLIKPLGIGVAVAAGLAAASLAVFVAIQAHALETPCPAGSRSTQPKVVALRPSLLRHQSWVGIAEGELVRNSYVFACNNGLAVGEMHTDHIELDPATGLVRLHIATRWVDLAWAAGHLDEYHAPTAWEIVFAPNDAARVPGGE